MRIASFNVENLFERAKALNQATWADGKPILEKHKRINDLLNQPVYTDGVKAEIRQLLIEFKLRKRDDAGKLTPNDFRVSAPSPSRPGVRRGQGR